MGEHTFDASRAGKLEDESRYAYLSVDELLGALDPGPEDTVVDLGSGTGFYTRSIATMVGRVLAVDRQPAMHAAFGDVGVPTNVDRLTAAVGALPIATGVLQGAVSTMTYHEFAGAGVEEELRRVLEPGSRVVIADWSAAGDGERGPPISERFDAEAVADTLESAGFGIDRARDRRETLFVLARAPGEPSRQS